MSYTGKILAAGQLASSQAAIATAGADLRWFVTKLPLFNGGVTTQTIQLWIKLSGGTARKWRRYVLLANESADPLADEPSLILNEGDAIEASTTNATTVDFTAIGVEYEPPVAP